MKGLELLKEAQESVVLLDGGMGSSLIARGLEHKQPGEVWNLERPDQIKEAHSLFVEAGARVIQTNTFGASPFRLKSFGLAQQFVEINQAACDLARSVTPEKGWVAGNIGPCGQFLPPLSDADPKEIEESFENQAEVLCKAGVDYISIETMMDLPEARLALKGAKNGAPDLLVSVTMVFENKRGGYYTPMGQSADLCLNVLADDGANMTGANCSMGSEAMRDMADLLYESSKVPLVMKPNAGLPEVEDGRTVYKQAPEDFAKDIIAMVEAGARMVGGCCGADHLFIKAVKEQLDSLSLD